MATPGQRIKQHPARPWPGRAKRTVLLVLLNAVLLACASHHSDARLLARLAPLQLEDRLVTAQEVPGRVPTPDLLALDQEMREFVQRNTGGVSDDQLRLLMLHRALGDPATLGMHYDPLAEGTARDAFHRGTANCLSYASVFIALAREAGLNANYQWLEVRPQWTREGERTLVRLHVNALVSLGKREQYMVDIDPLPSRDVAGSRQIGDADAQALHHSNIAMHALAADDTEQAWLQAVRALQLSPHTPHLWVNLGVIYRANGQHSDAEHSYLYALQLDPREYSAMNNLVVLYGIEGRRAEHDFWRRRVAHYRDNNPFYHAWLGDVAAAAGEWQAAVVHYDRALALSPQDSRLLSALGQCHEQLGEMTIASEYLQRAIAAATKRTDIETYQLQLHALQRRQLAGI